MLPAQTEEGLSIHVCVFLSHTPREPSPHRSPSPSASHLPCNILTIRCHWAHSKFNLKWTLPGCSLTPKMRIRQDRQQIEPRTRDANM